MTFFKKTLLILSLGIVSLAAAQKVDTKAKKHTGRNLCQL